jgi:2-dehydro-3-deoxyphosphogluconate aldolase/(4S)-4-hydroxy-2-oxoglutarate aldolase
MTGVRQATESSSTTSRAAVVATLRERGAVAVLRFGDARHTERAADWLVAAGVTVLEVTLTTPGALESIATLAARFGDDALVGAGSVLDPDAARRAIDAGARFVVSPVCDAQVMRATHALDVAMLPGAFTPTEILHAHELGADAVKVFPSEALGPAFIKGVLGPMPFLQLVPTGGVTPENAGDWLRAGAMAVGLGSALADPRLVAAGDEAAVTARARRLVESVAAARESPQARGGAA